MRYKKVLLLNAAYEDNYFDLQPELTVGLGYIAEALKSEGIAFAYGNFLLRNLFIGNKIARKFVIDPVKKLARISE